MSVLKATNIKKCFGGVTALCDGNIRCAKGRITGLLGANGSGKSTMSKIITGVYGCDDGEIEYKGKKIKFRNPLEAKKNGIAMVYQNLSLVADLNVWQNVVLGMERKKGIFFLDNANAKKRAKNIIDDLYPGIDINSKVSDLNPGEMQIVEIAKAIFEEPEVLILDEATAALEQAQVESLFKHMRRLADKGVAMIFTSHRLGEVLEICNDLVIFRNGENVASIDFDTDEKDLDQIVEYLTGDRTAGTVKKDHSDIKNEFVLSADGLRYGKFIRDINFELKKGEVLGIGGLAGQGQTELMLALAGFYPLVEGTITLGDKKMKLNKPKKAVRNGIYIVPGDRQKQGLLMKDSVYTNTIFAKLGLKNQPFFTPRKKYRKETEEIVEALSIKTNSIDTSLDTLSGGNQQKVVVGKLLPFDINILLLADPAKGVDVGAKRDLYNYVEKLVAEKDMSVILYASDIEELVEYCDRLLIMYEGKFVAELIGDEIEEERIIAASMNMH